MNKTILYAILAVYIVYLIWANWWARRKYPHFLCSPCKGTGKVWEPKAFQVSRLSLLKRRYRKCLPCDGKG